MAVPRVSFILPTLNAAAILPACLASIRAQNYDAEAVEILVADGGSSDGTRALAARHGAVIIDNPQRRAEPGKQLAFARARGDYLVFLDADNEIVGSDWLRRAVGALESHPDALGFESYYLKNPRDCALNRYVTALLLVSSDPIVRTLSRMPRLVEEAADGTQVFELPADGSYPTGANGFVFRRELLLALPAGQTFHEATFFPDRIREGCRQLVKIRGCGIYHYYVSTWADYLAKRRYTMVNYMLRKQEHARTWDGGGPDVRKLLALLYHATLIGPLLEGVGRAIVSRDADWLLHPAASAVSVLGNTLGLIDYYRAGSTGGGVNASVRLHRHATRQPGAGENHGNA